MSGGVVVRVLGCISRTGEYESVHALSPLAQIRRLNFSATIIHTLSKRRAPLFPLPAAQRMPNLQQFMWSLRPWNYFCGIDIALFLL
jgi:hypothetical protein